MPNKEKQPIKRKFQGVVTSDKADKTIVVAIQTTKLHPKYLKRFNTTKKYKVHDEKNEYKVGDVVEFLESRPVSKDKRWRVIGKKEVK